MRQTAIAFASVFAIGIVFATNGYQPSHEKRNQPVDRPNATTPEGTTQAVDPPGDAWDDMPSEEFFAHLVRLDALPIRDVLQEFLHCPTAQERCPRWMILSERAFDDHEELLRIESSSQDRDERVVARCLVRYSTEDLYLKAGPGLEEFLAHFEHESEAVRWVAVQMSTWHNSRVMFAGIAAAVVKQYGQPGRVDAIVQALSGALTDESAEVRISAINALAWAAQDELISVDSFEEELGRVKDDEDPRINKRVRELLSALVCWFGESDVARRSGESRVNSPDPTERSNGRQAVSVTRRSRSLPRPI
ncbi:MAG: hypothetical protein CMJ48_02620 [Planctomycetaceae bacterium]|nr:hypothetical protein [Planctomycetaceae bacterium]